MGPVAAAYWGHPSRDLTVVGVTGTNGKTTMTHLLASVARRRPAGRASVIGTLSGARTTPEAPELQALLAARPRRGATGRWRWRCRRTRSSCTGSTAPASRWRCSPTCPGTTSTSTTRWRPTSRPRPACSPRRFTGTAVVVHRRPAGPAAGATTCGPGRAGPAPLRRGRRRRRAGSGRRARRFRWRGQPVSLAAGGPVQRPQRPGRGHRRRGARPRPPPRSPAGLAAAPPVPGRFESVDAGQPFTVLVDYAHKPDAPRAGAVDRPRARWAVRDGSWSCSAAAATATAPSARSWGRWPPALADRGRAHVRQPALARTRWPSSTSRASPASPAGRRPSTVEPDRGRAIALAVGRRRRRRRGRDRGQGPRDDPDDRRPARSPSTTAPWPVPAIARAWRREARPR